jgi:ferrous iron transport protein A
MKCLADMFPQERGIVDLIDTGMRLYNRLASMGISDGSEFKVVLNRNNGPVVIDVDGNRLAIGRGMAKKIFIREHNGKKDKDCCCR